MVATLKKKWRLGNKGQGMIRAIIGPQFEKFSKLLYMLICLLQNGSIKIIQVLKHPIPADFFITHS